MKISLLGINFAPERTGIGPYTTRVAAHLARSHDVTVFAGTPHYPEWERHGDRPKLRTERTEQGVRVLSHRHYVPSEQSALRRGVYEASWATNVARSALATRADVVIATVPALLSAPLGHAIGRVQRAPVGVIVQDVMSVAARQSGISGGSRAARFAAQIEGRALRLADSIVTIHPQLAAEIQGRFALSESPHVIYNWSHIGTARPADVHALRRARGWGSDTVVLHSGNMGLKQDLRAVLDAARLSSRRGQAVRFVLSGGGSQFRALSALAADLANVEVVTGVPEEEFPTILAAADILLINERPGMQSMSLPSKLTSYFIAERPVVAATDDDSATAAFVRAAGAGLVIPAGKPAELLSAINILVSSEDYSMELGRNAGAFARTHLKEEVALNAYSDWVEGLARRNIRGRSL